MSEVTIRIMVIYRLRNRLQYTCETKEEWIQFKLYFKI